MHKYSKGWSSQSSQASDQHEQIEYLEPVQTAFFWPLEDLKPLDYHVPEEQPPYSVGHQNIRNFTKLFIHNIDYTITREMIVRVFN